MPDDLPTAPENHRLHRWGAKPDPALLEAKARGVQTPVAGTEWWEESLGLPRPHRLLVASRKA
ncbi:hypothetical protein GCM10009716_01620 [Streptomyces sodiiphilus]|uniref:SAM-dependent methyltransferase n=1 Tax=Streptomyces sodiiphilus TaxID=226217 RepID=A0ABN2NQM0_9ACTN